MADGAGAGPEPAGKRRALSSSSSRCSAESGEERLCRVCRCGEECGPLYYPCLCKGSIRFVHEECLVRWLKVSHKYSCELCLTEFEFKSVYRAGAPARLSSLQVLLGSLQLGLKLLPQVSHYVVIGAIWLVALPLFTARTHALFFTRRTSDFEAVCLNWELEAVAKDCLFGLFLTGCIVCAFLALMVLQDYARRNEWQDLGNDNINVRNLRRGLDRNIVDIADRVVEAAVAAAADANDLVEEIQAAGENNRLLEFGNRFLREHVGNPVHSDDDDGDDDGDDDHDDHDEGDGDETFGPAPVANVDPAPAPAPGAPAQQAEEQERPADEEVMGLELDEFLEDDDGLPHGRDEDLAWEVLVGLRGGVQRGLYTMSLVALANTLFLAVWQLIPFTLGRVLLLGARKTLNVEANAKFRQSFIAMGVRAFENDDLYTLGIGYGFLLVGILLYLGAKKLRDLWRGRNSVSAPDVVSKYAAFLLQGMLDVLSMWTIVLMELFLLSEAVGWVAHAGIMGVSGDFWDVLTSRLNMCSGAPLTCMGIHWAVGSVVIANWSALIWAFRQVVHPYFRVRLFEGWYDASKSLEMGRFGPLIALQERRVQEHTHRWHERVEAVAAQVRLDEERFGQLGGRVEELLCVDAQAPVAEAEIENAAVVQPSVISQSLDESFSYVSTVLLWCVPAVFAFLVCPIHLTKWAMPWVFPLRIGNFREPFADAQLPLDVFLFHSLPYLVERLHLSQVFLDSARVVATMLTRPLDLHGYVLKPALKHMRSGFVHVVRAPGRVAGPLVEPSPGRCRRVRVPLTNALRGLPDLSSCAPDSRVGVLGVACAVVPWSDLAPQLRAADGCTWADEPTYVCTVTDSLGYCVPVLLQLSTSGSCSREALGRERERAFRHEAQRAVLRFFDAVAKEASALPKWSNQAVAQLLADPVEGTDSAYDVIAAVRELLEDVQGEPELVDMLLDHLPSGLGVSWLGGSGPAVVAAARLLSRVWRDDNVPPVVALQDAKVSERFGRSLVLDEQSLIMLEPDAGGRTQLLRACFDARREEHATGGQFCVLRHEPPRLLLRLKVLAVLAAVASVVASTTALVLPLLSGRALFSLVGDPLKHDLYHWGGGCFVVWLGGMLSKWLLKAIFSRDGGPRRALQLCLMWALQACKWAVMLFVFAVVIPLLTGAAFELVVLDPMRVARQRTPVFLIFQDWALGLAVLKAWSRLVLLGVFGETVWEARLDKIQQGGRDGLDLGFALRDLAAPMLHYLCLRLCAPYVLSCLAERAWDLDAASAQRLLQLSFPAFSAFLWLRTLLAAANRWLHAMHDIVFDAHYRVGRRLQNR